MNIIEEWLAEKTTAGKAEGEIEAILRLVAKGRLAVDAARDEIMDLVAACTITRSRADASLAKLGWPLFL